MRLRATGYGLRVLAVATLAACAPKHAPPPPEVVDPVELLARARSGAPTAPQAAGFGVRIDTPDQHVTANGTLVVAPTDRFRLEVRGPLGPPQLIVASDGTGLWAWQAGKQTLWEAPDADQALSQASEGMADMGALASLLLGRLPPGLGEPASIEGATYVWSAPHGLTVKATLDPRTAEVSWFEARDADGKVWAEMSANVPERTREYRLPVQGIAVRIELQDWDEASPDPSIFRLTAPEGAQVKPLEITPPGAAADAAAP